MRYKKINDEVKEFLKADDELCVIEKKLSDAIKELNDPEIKTLLDDILRKQTNTILLRRRKFIRRIEMIILDNS